MANEARRPQKCISVEKARELEANWVKTRAPEIERTVGFQDARDFSWTLEELQEYLDYVRAESKAQGITNPGIRVYLGAYSKGDDNQGRPADLATVFFAPTGTKGRGSGKDGDGDDNNYNIDPYNFGNQGWPPNNY